MSYNVEGYEHGETVLYNVKTALDTVLVAERVIVDEVLDDTIAVRYEGDDFVFTVDYNDVVRPAKSIEELID